MYCPERAYLEYRGVWRQIFEPISLKLLKAVGHVLLEGQKCPVKSKHRTKIECVTWQHKIDTT